MGRFSSAWLVAIALMSIVVACGGGSSGASPSPTPSAAPTATARVSIQQPTATATVEPPATATDVPPEPSPTPDTRVAIRDLPTVDQIQLGPDGKYFIADRGDGCTWLEYFRRNDPDIGEEVFLKTDCPADFAITFRPESGEISMLVP